MALHFSWHYRVSVRWSSVSVLIPMSRTLIQKLTFAHLLSTKFATAYLLSLSQISPAHPSVPISLRSILVLSHNLCFSLSRNLSSLVFTTKILSAFLFMPSVPNEPPPPHWSHYRIQKTISIPIFIPIWKPKACCVLTAARHCSGRGAIYQDSL